MKIQPHYRLWRPSADPMPALVLLAVAAPFAPLALSSADPATVVYAAKLYGLLVTPAVLGAALAAYGAWHIRPRRELGWVAAVLAGLGVEMLSLAVLQVVAPQDAGRRDLWTHLVDLLILAGVGVAAHAARRVDVPGDPLQLGLAAGAAASLLRLVSVTRMPVVILSHPAALGTVIAFATLAVACVVATARLSGLGGRNGPHLASAAALLAGVQMVASYASPTLIAAAGVLTLSCLAAIVTCGTGLGILQRTYAESHEELDHLSVQVVTAEQLARRSRATMHEVTSTLAGITSAHHLIHSPEVSHKRRLMLERMVDAELARLTRLVSAPEVHPPGHRTVDLDATIETLAQAHEARGNPVRWSRSGVRPVAQPDDLAEVLNILLDNVAKHGRIATASIEVTESSDHVEIAVSDQGPGVAASVRLFDWGARGPDSPGQGIGLHIARELMERQGGYLRLRAGDGCGCTFVVGLPTSKDVHHDASASAHAS